jgi:hypothetical protein
VLPEQQGLVGDPIALDLAVAVAALVGAIAGGCGPGDAVGRAELGLRLEVVARQPAVLVLERGRGGADRASTSVMVDFSRALAINSWPLRMPPMIRPMITSTMASSTSVKPYCDASSAMALDGA